jgi:hypothetical protein
MRKKQNKRWEVEIKFVPFETESRRQESYRAWAQAFLSGKRKELVYEASRESETCANPAEKAMQHAIQHHSLTENK